jgi:hypothetical protein
MKKYFDSFFEKICILLFIRIFQNIFTADFGGCAVICASHVIGHFVRYKLRVIGAAPLLGTSCVIWAARYLGYAVICFALLVLRTLLDARSFVCCLLSVICSPLSVVCSPLSKKKKNEYTEH